VVKIVIVDDVVDGHRGSDDGSVDVVDVVRIDDQSDVSEDRCCVDVVVGPLS